MNASGTDRQQARFRGVVGQAILLLAEAEIALREVKAKLGAVCGEQLGPVPREQFHELAEGLRRRGAVAALKRFVSEHELQVHLALAITAHIGEGVAGEVGADAVGVRIALGADAADDLLKPLSHASGAWGFGGGCGGVSGERAKEAEAHKPEWTRGEDLQSAWNLHGPARLGKPAPKP